MRLAIRSILVSLLALSLSGCFLVYKLPTRQGNVIDQKQFDLLKVGQTREQVKFLLGTPIATSPFRTDRWDYFGYYKDPRGKVSTRTISLFFAGDKLDRMEGVQIASNSTATGSFSLASGINSISVGRDGEGCCQGVDRPVLLPLAGVFVVIPCAIPSTMARGSSLYGSSLVRMMLSQNSSATRPITGRFHISRPPPVEPSMQIL